MTPQQLVQNVLLGNGVTATNIVYTGDPLAIANFGGTTNLGIGTGLIMTTGITTGATGPQGPNNSSSAGTDNSQPGDVLLDAASSAATKNAAVLEFDFIPSGDTINFHYVFGSEEYPEFACSSFNDIFGFFITGPNPAGGSYSNKNLAIVPNTTSPVSINSVNLGTNTGCTVTYPNFYVDNTNGTSIQYDGFTVPLTASAAIVCGATYHIKLAIADAFDGYWDSGVFLEAGSFSSKSISITSKVAFGGNDTTIFEGCGLAQLILSRNTSANYKADTIGFTISGTATYGTDYTLSSTNINGNNIIFPIGVDSVQLDLNAIQDLLPEGLEKFIITFTVRVCNKIIQKSVVIYIDDVAPIKVSVGNDTTLNCSNKAISIKAVASGGIALGSYIYSWSNGATTASISVNPQVTTKYVVSVKDTCGLYDAKDSMTVFISYSPITLTVSNNVGICMGDSANLVATAILGLPGYNYLWKPGNYSTNNIYVKPLNTTTYTVTVIDSCGLQVSQTVTVNVTRTAAEFDYLFSTNSDVDFENISVDATNSFWIFGDSTTSNQTNPTHTYADSGTYNVTLIVSSINGCVDTVTHTLIVLPDLYFYFPNSFTPNNNGTNDVFTGKGIGITKYKMTIFDRWGNMVYTTEDINNGWDGKTKHAKAQTEIYVCVFDVADNHGHNVHKVGSITLIR